MCTASLRRVYAWPRRDTNNIRQLKSRVTNPRHTRRVAMNDSGIGYASSEHNQHTTSGFGMWHDVWLTPSNHGHAWCPPIKTDSNQGHIVSLYLITGACGAHQDATEEDRQRQEGRRPR